MSFSEKGDSKVVSEGLSLSASFDLCDISEGKGKIFKFLRGVLCRHFDLFFLGVKILLTSSVGGGCGY
jgi:hypothetical protein